MTLIGLTSLRERPCALALTSRDLVGNQEKLYQKSLKSNFQTGLSSSVTSVFLICQQAPTGFTATYHVGDFLQELNKMGELKLAFILYCLDDVLTRYFKNNVGPSVLPGQRNRRR